MTLPGLHKETTWVVTFMENANATDELRAAISKVVLKYMVERASRRTAALNHAERRLAEIAPPKPAAPRGRTPWRASPCCGRRSKVVLGGISIPDNRVTLECSGCSKVRTEALKGPGRVVREEANGLAAVIELFPC